ncbi:MAG: TonB-dependent receptor [Bacteroidetes bacterium]|nr:TonB-dependent receptor [Bacteroidota bacterium]
MKSVLLLLFTSLIFSVSAQVKISGKVTDAKNRPVAGASITLKNTYDGATTDSTGNYAFTTTEKGEQVIEITSTGFKLFEQKITIANTDIKVSATLKELVTELTAVVISTGSFEASDKKKGAVLSDIDIVTTPSANGDITSAFKSLPGSQQVGESEGLFVRGGTATESKIFIDGTQVNNFFFSGSPGVAQRGRFNPFLFKGTVFSTGGYSALYGQALSSALILESKDLPERSEADLGVSVVGVGGGMQHLAKDKKSSWGFSGNYTNLWLAFNVIKQKLDYFKIPVISDLDANFRFTTKGGGMIKMYSYISQTTLGSRTYDLDSLSMKDAFTLKNVNQYHNISWKQPMKNKWKFSTGLSYSNNKDNIDNELQDGNNVKQVITNPNFYAYKNFSLHTNGDYFQNRIMFDKKLKGLSGLRFGSELSVSNEQSTYTLYDGSSYKGTVKETMAALFGESDIYLTNSLAAKVGVRTEHSDLLKKWNIAPRASLAYQLGKYSSAGFAYGIFYQNPERKYLPTTSVLDFSKATHYILQYQMLTSVQTLRMELFYKKYNDLYKTGFNNFNQEVVIGNGGFGYAKGFELFWRDKKTIKNVDYWISYSYLDTQRDFLNFPASIQPSFAAKHTAAFVFKKFIMPWKTQFNLSYNFATGRPYYRIAYDNTLQKNVFTDRGTTINYNSCSFSANYLPNIGKKNPKVFAVWVLGINNVFGQKQIYTYNYSTDGTRKQPVTAQSTRFAFIGCFLSFGTDRTQDAINNNL